MTVPAPAPVAPAAPSVAAKAPSPLAAKPGAVAPAAAPAGAPEAFLELVIDGEKRSMTRAEVERYASKGGFADKVTQKAREAIKDALKAKADYESKETARKTRAKSDTEAFLKEHGIDPDEFARQRLDKKIDEGRMTAEQREAAQLKAENQRLKGEQAKLEAAREAERQTSQVRALQSNIEKTLADSAKRAGIEPGDESFFAIYESFRDMYELGLLPTDGLQPHHADRIIEDAQSRIEGTQKALEKAVLSGLAGPRLLNRLGPEVVKAVLAARLTQLRGDDGVPKPVAAAHAPNTPQPKPSGYMTVAEADAQVKKLMNGAR